MLLNHTKFGLDSVSLTSVDLASILKKEIRLHKLWPAIFDVDSNGTWRAQLFSF